jgi:hypothetical protein
MEMGLGRGWGNNGRVYVIIIQIILVQTCKCGYSFLRVLCRLRLFELSKSFRESVHLRQNKMDLTTNKDWARVHQEIEDR